MTFPGPSLPRSPERYAHKTQAVIQELRQTLRRNGLTIAKQEGLLYFIIFIILMMVIGFGYLAYDINQDLPPEEYEEERDPELDALTFIFLLMALGMVMGPFLTEYFFCLGTSS